MTHPEKPFRPGIPCLHCIVRDALIEDMIIDLMSGPCEQSQQMGQALGQILAEGREVGHTDKMIFTKAGECVLAFARGLNAGIKFTGAENVADLMAERDKRK